MTQTDREVNVLLMKIQCLAKERAVLSAKGKPVHKHTLRMALLTEQIAALEGREKEKGKVLQ